MENVFWVRELNSEFAIFRINECSICKFNANLSTYLVLQTDKSFGKCIKIWQFYVKIKMPFYEFTGPISRLQKKNL